MSISQLFAKSFLTLSKRSSGVDKPELSLSRRIFLKFSFVKKLAIYYFGTWGEIPRTMADSYRQVYRNRHQRVERNTLRQIQKIKTVNLQTFSTPLKKVSRISGEQLSARLARCTSFYVSIGSFLKKKLSKKTLFKVNLTLGPEKLNFWQTFSVRFVIADFYVSKGLFKKKHFGKKWWVLRSCLTKTFSEFGTIFCAVVETEVKLSRRYLAGTETFFSKHLDNHFPTLNDNFLCLCRRFPSELS